VLSSTDLARTLHLITERRFAFTSAIIARHLLRHIRRRLSLRFVCPVRFCRSTNSPTHLYISQALSINPVISGDGSFVAFESTADIFDTSGASGFRLLRAAANASIKTTQFIALTRAPAPAVSQDGRVIAFAAASDPLGTNPDRNSEIFVFTDAAGLRQLTNTAPRDPTQRVTDGNFSPSISDDGRFIAFSSTRDILNRNPDLNHEIILYDDATKLFAQLTDTRDAFGSTDAKISGDASHIAFLFDAAASTQPNAPTRNLLLRELGTGRTRTIVSDQANLALTYGRAISDDGTRIVFAANTATNASQVFLFDARLDSIRQLTTLGSRSGDVPLHPTISGDGSRIAFATRRTVRDTANADRSVELYVYDLPLAQFTKLTDAPANANAEVVASLNDDGAIIAFNFSRSLTAPATEAAFALNSEIYLATLPSRPPPATNLIIRNAASLDNAAPPLNVIAPNSIAVARGSNLALATQQSPANIASLPTQLAGTTVIINNRRAQLLSVSPSQVSFLVPPDTPFGVNQIIVTNADGLQTTGIAEVFNAAPGVFTTSGDGAGEAVALDATTFRRAPFDSPGSSTAPTHILVFATGARSATTITATIDGEAAPVERILAPPDVPGLDQIEIALPRNLTNRGRVLLTITADGRTSNPTTLRITGLTFNEILADPPDALAGDANRDGVRSASADEFIEFVNSSSSDIDISGFEVRTIDDGNADGVLRHRFESGTIITAGTAIVVFGDAQAATFNPAHTAFGEASVVLASSGGLALRNGGSRIMLRSTDGRTVDEFTYGSSGGISGNRSQSITRQPDTRGDFALHAETFASGNRLFSPGTRVDATPFVATPAVARITIEPVSINLLTNQSQRFTARAFGFDGEELTGVRFTWQTNDPNVLSINADGLATAKTPGTATVTANARGRSSTPAQVSIAAAPPSIVRVEVSPSTASVNRGESLTFTARAFNADGNEVSGTVFNFASSNPLVAVIDTATPTALVRGVGIGQALIRATTSDGAGGTVSGAATVDVKIPLIINEILADVPRDDETTANIEGDANRDGVRDGDDDEFVEIINNSAAPLDLTGIRIRDNSANRFTFPAASRLAPGQAALVFGGGAAQANDPAFGGALVLRASSLGLNDTGDTVTLRLPIGTDEVTIATQNYSLAGDAAPAPSDQSLTRSPDASPEVAESRFVAHLAAANAAGRVYSPGTRTDGTPHSTSPITRIAITPDRHELKPGDKQTFIARAFAFAGEREIEIPNTSFVWESSDATRLNLTPSTGSSTTATALRSGVTEISARAGGISASATITIRGTVASVELSPAARTLDVGEAGVFRAQARDAAGDVIPEVGFEFSIREQSPANAASIVETTGETASVRGDVAGTAQLIAQASGVTSNPTLLTIRNPPPRITRIELSPATASINRGATQIFTARAFDEQSREVPDTSITFASSDATIATVSASGAARGTGVGEATITATTPDNRGGIVTASASLTVALPLSINEILADVPPDDTATRDIEGDANRDGVRNSGDDEFVELLNTSAQPLDISGVEIADATTTRFRFAPNTVLPASSAAVVFGGGNPAREAAQFGGAQIFSASSLSLNDGGDIVRLSLRVGAATVLINEVRYGANPGDAPAPRDQSLTRSPDAGGDAQGGAFVAHTAALNSDARPYSPGTRVNGTPFGSIAITRIEVTPASTVLEVGATARFSARAFGASNNVEIEIPNVSFIWQSSIENRLELHPRTGREINATATRRGTVELFARAGGIDGNARVTITPIVASIVLTPAAANIFENEETILRATARDAAGVEIENLTYSFTLRDASPADAAIITATTADSVTVRAQRAGGVSVVASYTRPGDNVVIEDESRITISTQPPRIVRIELTPAMSVINRGGSQSFTARAFDENGNEAASQTFTFTTSDAAVAAVNADGIARGAGIGTVTIRAATSDNRGGTVAGEATLTVRVGLVVNEILADVPVDNTATVAIEGDANRDGTRNSDDDEFIEIVNASAQPLDVSGIRLADATLTRFTFPANTNLAPGQAAIIFGGGTPPANDPAFGGALVFTTGSLSLNDSGDTVIIRLPLGSTEILIASQTYGTSGEPPAAQDESLTRSPDAASDATGGALVPHRTATNAFARVFSPGTRADGTPFNSTALTRIEIVPARAEFETGVTERFTARAFTLVNGIETEVPNVSFLWTADAPERVRIAPFTGAFTNATGAARGAVELSARAGNVRGSASLIIQPVVASIELTPATRTINETEETIFTATARDAAGEEIPGTVFNFSLRDASPSDAASITNTTANAVTVRGVRAGTVNVIASFVRARDNVTLEDSSQLTIQALPPRIARVEVTPSVASINRGGTIEFSARAFDETGVERNGATFNFTSGDAAIATIDNNGFARGTGIGAVTIRASTADNRSGTVTGDATLTVSIPISINEIFADVPADDPATADVEGDANRDGVRSADDDEFIEIVNASDQPVELSGVRLFDATNLRFTFPANTLLASGRAALIFGGGAPTANANEFGGSLVFTTSSLSLNDGGDRVSLRLPSGAAEVVIATQSYGTGESGSPAAPADQSLVRAPDASGDSIGGAFIPHAAATNAAGRIFSTGTRSDGTPFGSPALTRIEISPSAATIDVGASQTFNARAFATLADNTEVEVPNVSFIWDATENLQLAPRTGRSTTVNPTRAANAIVRARAGGRAASAALNVNAVVATIELTPETASVAVGNEVTFTAVARDASGGAITNINFVFSIRDAAPSNTATITNQTASTVTLRGDAAGSATLLASYTRPSDGRLFEDTAALTVTARPEPPAIPTTGEVVINEAVVAFTTSTTQARADFVELYNRTARTLDISGLVISFRPAGSSNTPRVVTLPGAVGSGTTLIEPNGYFVVANGASVFGETRVYDASASNFDLNNTTGGILIEVNSVKLDGLSYQGGSTAPAATFINYGERTVFTFVSGGTNDLVRQPNGADTDDNAADFRRNGTTANVSPRAANPLVP
jgi:uncharacterized protein (TIGR03437 family)